MVPAPSRPFAHWQALPLQIPKLPSRSTPRKFSLASPSMVSRYPPPTKLPLRPLPTTVSTLRGAGERLVTIPPSIVINFCLTRSDLPLTNGAQVKTGSCNNVPLGVIAAQANMPSSKFTVSPSRFVSYIRD